MGDFFRGISSVSEGFTYLTARGLRPFVWLPVLVNAIVFVGLFWLGYEWLQNLLRGFLPNPSHLDTGTFLGSIEYYLTVTALWLLLPLYLLASTVVAFFTFTAIANLIAAPFNGMLAARVEHRLTGAMPPDVESGGIMVESVGAIGDEIRKILYFAKWGIPLLIVSFIPVINLVAAPLWLVYGVWVITLEYMDYPLGNRGIKFAAQRELIRGRLLYHLGFGAGIMAMTLIPGVNLLAMPTGVIAATVVRTRIDGNTQLPARR